MNKNILNFILAISLLSFILGCGSNNTGSSNDKKSIIANANATYEVIKGNPIKISASNIVDTSKVEKYEWSIDDGLISNSQELNMDIHQDIGIHEVCLKLTYKDGTTQTSCRDIKVIDSKLGKPTAIINNIPNLGWKTKCPVTLTANQSKVGVGGTIKSYKWLKDNKEIGSNENQTYTFYVKGKHNITLQIKDNEGNIDTKTKSVDIQEIGQPIVKLTVRHADLNGTPDGNPYFITSRNTSDDIPTLNDDINITDNSKYNKDEWPPTRGTMIYLSANGSKSDCNLTESNLTYEWHGESFRYDENGEKHIFFADCFHGRQLKSEDYNNTGENVFLHLCKKKKSTYTHVKFTLIVKDNKHDINTTISKIFRTQPSDEEIKGKL